MPKDIWNDIEKEAIERGCTMADVWREIIIEHGYPAWAAARGDA